MIDMNVPDYDKLNGGAVQEKSIQIHYPEFYQYIIENYPKDLQWKEKLYWYYKGLTTRPICKVCGKPTEFVNIKVGYREYCSRKCLNSDPDKKERVKQTNIERYGGVAPSCSDDVKQKSKESNLKKYGVDNAMKNSDVSSRSRKTNVERYGGCGNASNELKKKQQETLQKVFGSSNYMQCGEFYDIVAKRHPDVMTVDIINRTFECKCPDMSCTRCLNKSYHVPISQYHNRSKMNGVYRCTTFNPIHEGSGKCTNIELFVRNILDKYNINYTTNDRSIISPLELDIYIPEKHIAIECNGIYYHNSSQKEKNYHQEKYRLCKLKGLQLVSVWEDWIYKKPDIVFNIILSKLGLYNRVIPARKCTVRQIEASDSNLILNTYHLQGGCPSDIKYGLFFNEELVSVMTFANHRNNIIGCSGWELVRFCTIAGVRVVGGAQKLLTYFIREHHPDQIVSFSMNDISNGNVYNKLGFEESGSNQSYWYVDSKDYKRYHRSSFTKDSIIKKGWKDSKSGWTEFEVMKEKGYYQIYDSGQTKWVLKIMK